MSSAAGVALESIDWRLETIPGVGKKTLESLEAANIFNLWQLLCHCPSRYEDYASLTESKDWKNHIGKEAILIEGPVAKSWAYFSGGKRLTYCQIQTEDLSIRIGFFHLHPQIKKKMAQEGVLLRCFGKLVLSGNTVAMYHPKYWIVDDGDQPLEQTLTPIYKTIPGVGIARLQKIIASGLNRVITVDAILTSSDHAMPIGKALQCIHQPNHLDAEKLAKAYWRLAQEEAKFWSLLLTSAAKKIEIVAPLCKSNSKLCEQFIKALPFALTADQLSSYQDIEKDISKTQPMHRLLQGDVGCGKTVVATLAMLQAVDAGFQAVLLVPTVVLAKQHAKKLAAWLQPLQITSELLISESAETLKQKKQSIAAGDISIIIGTHALLTEDVAFKSLALVVVDEQHRFGVKQRDTLMQRGVGGQAHALMMSATPIPQSLAQSFFGVTDCSSIQSMPSNRKPIQTSLLSSTKRDQLLMRVIEQAKAGKQIYWICPRVDIDDTHMSAIQMFEKVQALNGGIAVALLHGRMSAEVKMDTLERFAQGDIKLLVSTVVVEVGVDVPAATIMVIDHAQIFGLAQLHQLRGRVGRSDQQGYCILLYDAALTEEGLARLECLKQSADGFELAEKDLQMRGPGQIIGFKQSGYPSWRFLKWPEHRDLLVQNKNSCNKGACVEKNYLAKLLWAQKSKA